MWSMSCLRPLPPSRPQFVARDDTKSPKLQRKASTLGRRKNNGWYLMYFRYRYYKTAHSLENGVKL